eukprot:TRINITY_DN5497_c0_g1_i1.p1 TRINITY_DN5497_c0_g1~~TRINITY_DN5497_c0_g1_i1.p1  ORF type:complete len:162 (+),score=25.56 TRINITY_DN5497_c0_g1_i1:94-579(+)
MDGPSKTAKTSPSKGRGGNHGGGKGRGRGRGRGRGGGKQAVRGRGGLQDGRTKRQPSRPARSRTDIYIGRNSPFEAQLARAQSLLSAGETTITLHGLGAAINRCINLALQLEQQGKGKITLDLKTDSVALLDDLPADDPEATPKIAKRTASAVHIAIKKIA